ncbi:MAG: hypothetical protein VB835_09815 [Pirellulales bacterium]
MNNQRLRNAIAFALITSGSVTVGEETTEHRPLPTKVVEIPAYRIDRELRKQLSVGILVSFTKNKPGAVSTDMRAARLAALHVAANSPPSVFLSPGPFRATFEGFLKLKLKTECVLSFAGRGKARLLINNTPVLSSEGGDLRGGGGATVALGKYNQIRLEYESPGDGPAEFRLYWKSAEFAREPVPPNALMYNATDARLLQDEQRRRGRELFANHGCHKCHSANTPDLAAAEVMPDLKKQGPSLDEAGSRLKAAWLVAWLLEPHALRNKITMPALFPEPTSAAAKREAVNIAAFVGGLGSGEGKESDLADADASMGGELFETLGCIACHRLTVEGDEPDELGRISLRQAPFKYHPGSLSRFLRAPRRHYPWSRMPNFQLTESEALSLEAYIRQGADGRMIDTPAASAGDTDEGKLAFARRGCANCHQTGVETVDAGAKRTEAGPQAELKGCLAADATGRGTGANFSFDIAARASLLAFLKTDRSSLARASVAEASQRYIRQLNCVACHRLDSLDSDLAYAIEEFGSGKPQDDLLPILTFAGERLHAVWTEKLLTGQLTARPRPWLKTRMPLFPVRASILSRGLAAQHGFARTEQVDLQIDREQAKIGQRLTVKDGGFDCMQCHGVGGQPPTATFDARGVNLHTTADRVRHEYYRRWMFNPQRFDPTTKMPRYSMDGQTTSLDHIYAGDATRQYSALWHYIQSLRAVSLPEGKSGQH